MSVPASATMSTRLSALLADARTRASATGGNVLVSVVERVPAVDPLAVIATLGAEGEAVGETSDRMYWTRPLDGFALGGFGAVVVLNGSGADRFADIDRQWAAMRANAVIDDPSDGAPGAGPFLMGGFAFDPDGPHSPPWRDFPPARLVLPRVQVVTSEGGNWLTLNLLVAPDGNPDIAPAALASLRERALGATIGEGNTAVSSRVRTRRRPSGDAGESASGTKPQPRSSDARLADARSRSTWRDAVLAIVAAIRDGALEKVVLAREVRIAAAGELDVVATLRHLRAAHEASYVFGCWQGASAFVGASPELLVSLNGGDVSASSLAGSVARGDTPAEDAALAAGLMASTKDRVEHEVVRRALVENLSALCDDVTASEEPSLLSLPQVHHLHTDVRGRLRAGNSLLDLVEHLHPTPAVGGEPRDAALRFIAEHEGIDRGWYAGPIGWMQHDRGEFAVALRSALVTGREAALFAGCGIVADSDPDEEYAESLLKLRPMEMALAASVVASDSPPLRAVAGGRAKR